MKILFLLKQRNSYGGQYSVIESGLLNSARMTMEALVEKFGVKADLKVCVDGNSIDKELHAFKPDVAIIEAIWVTPAKIAELLRLHPNVYFIIRVHSEIPFLANEGVSVGWCKEYAALPRTYVAFNSERTKKDFEKVTKLPFYYLPNIYEKIKLRHSFSDLFERARKVPDIIDIGCFGAIRPMKNQLQQAVSAIIFAEKNRSTLLFHINTPRVEQGGGAVLKNLRNLFDGTRHYLIEHPWLPRKEFLELVKEMDAGMQVSFNESFNIVTADFVKMGTPIIVSPSIDWMPKSTQVDTENTTDMVRGLEAIFKFPKFYNRISATYLHNYIIHAINEWRNFLFL